MDLTFLLAIFAAIISATIALVTLWLTQFRGPDIALLNPPKDFEVGKQLFERAQKEDYTPRWIALKPVTFVFANQGGKSGLITNIELEFIPHTEFIDFFQVSYHFGEPIAIKKGEIQHFKLSPSIRTIDWKRNTLAKILSNSNEWNVDDAVSLALKESREKFRMFCDFLEKSEELGKLQGKITMTKGRFSTKVKKETLFKNIKVSIGQKKLFSSSGIVYQNGK